MKLAGDLHLSQGPSCEPGLVIVRDQRIFVLCAGNTWLELVELQLEGKKRLPAREFLHGMHLAGVVRLG